MAKLAPLARKLRGWWNGNAAPADAAAPDSDAADSASGGAGKSAMPFSLPLPDGRKAQIWADPRIRVVERVFGMGFLGPNNEAWAEQLIKPMILDSKMSVMHLSAGLGGITRAIHKISGSWVTGYESSPQLAAGAMELSNLASMAKKAPIVGYNPEEPEFKAESCNAIVATKAFAAVNNKQALYNAMFNALRIDGHVMMTEYLHKGSDAAAPAIVEWIKAEPRPIELASAEETGAALKRAGFDVRVMEDVSEDLQRRIAASWAAFARTLAEVGLDRGLVGSLTDELALWMARTRVLESGAVASYRIHAIKNKRKA